jgi:hypothetical protein
MQQVTITKTGETGILLELKDLRIGNILLYKGDYVHVTSLSMDIDDEYQETIGFCKLGKSTDEIADWNRALAADLSPVQITPEILERFGFSSLSVGSGDTSYHIEDSGNDFIVVHFVLEQKIMYDDREIKYAHQLQNLYFAMTMEELTLNSQPPISDTLA